MTWYLEVIAIGTIDKDWHCLVLFYFMWYENKKSLIINKRIVKKWMQSFGRALLVGSIYSHLWDD